MAMPRAPYCDMPTPCPNPLPVKWKVAGTTVATDAAADAAVAPPATPVLRTSAAAAREAGRKVRGRMRVSILVGALSVSADLRGHLTRPFPGQAQESTPKRCQVVRNRPST